MKQHAVRMIGRYDQAGTRAQGKAFGFCLGGAFALAYGEQPVIVCLDGLRIADGAATQIHVADEGIEL